MQLIQIGWFRNNLLPELLKCKASGIDLNNDSKVISWIKRNIPKKASGKIFAKWGIIKDDIMDSVDSASLFNDLCSAATNLEKIKSNEVTAITSVISELNPNRLVKPETLKLFLDLDKKVTAHPKLFITSSGDFLCPSCGQHLKRGSGKCSHCNQDPVKLFEDDEQNAKVQELLKSLMSYLAVKTITGGSDGEWEELEPLLTRDEFEKRVAKVYKMPIFIGINKDNFKVYITYNFCTSIEDTFEGKWILASVWFGAEKSDKMPYFMFKAPVIKFWKGEKKFNPKVAKWIKKRFKLKDFNNNKVSAEIIRRKKIVDSKYSQGLEYDLEHGAPK